MKVVKKVGCLSLLENGCVMLNHVPTWYPQLNEPKPFEEDKEDSKLKYSLLAFLNKKEHSDEIEFLEDLIRKNMKENCDWDDVETKNRCLLDGSKVKIKGVKVEPDSDIAKHYRIKFSANEDYAPVVRNAGNAKLNRRIPEELSEIKEIARSGKFMTILFGFYGWQHPKYGAGVTLNLHGVKVHNDSTSYVFGATSAVDTDSVDWGEEEAQWDGNDNNNGKKVGKKDDDDL